VSKRSLPAPSSGVFLINIAAREPVKHRLTVSTLREIEKAVEKLSPARKQQLMRFLASQLPAETCGPIPRNLSPAERAADLERWSASHDGGPGLPDSAIGRDAIYD
jgi:hypothetical protein